MRGVDPHRVDCRIDRTWRQSVTCAIGALLVCFGFASSIAVAQREQLQVVLDPGHNAAVFIRETDDGADPRSLFAESGVHIERLVRVPGGYLASYKQPHDPALASQLATQLESDPRVEYLEPDRCRVFLPAPGALEEAPREQQDDSGSSVATRGREIAGRVLDPDGQPLPQDVRGLVDSSPPTVRDFIEDNGPAWTPEPMQAVAIGADGSFSVTTQEPSTADDMVVTVQGRILLVAVEWELAEIPIPPTLGPTTTGSPGGEDPSDEPEYYWPVPTPPEYPTNEEDEEEPPCCGIKAGVITYPVTIDPLSPPEPTFHQMARHDPAIGAYQVMLHDGAFFENMNDLFLDSVGIPFNLSHHYRSHVDTESGGLLGHRWDFNLNKRIVPIANNINEEGLFVEQLHLNRPRLMYYDGHGRGDKYEARRPTRLRRVKNFEASFRAFVTTYRSPPGAFHEIQRYILFGRDSLHPFQDHPNVEDGERIFYVLRHKNGLQYIFNCRGQIIYALDRFYNRMEFRYGGALSALTYNSMLVEVIDTAGRKYTFASDSVKTASVDTNVECRHVTGPRPISFLTSVTDPSNRVVVFNYEHGDDGHELVSVEQVLGPNLTTRYTYDDDGNHLLTSITEPREAAEGGPPYLVNKWENLGEGDEPEYRVTKQRLGETDGDPLEMKAERPGDIINALDYAGDGIVVTDPNKNTREYRISPMPGGYVTSSLKHTGAAGEERGPWTTAFGHNAATQITRIGFPRGNSIEYRYASGGGPVTLGPVRNWADRDITYLDNLAAGNLLKVIWNSDRPQDAYRTVTIDHDYERLFNQVSERTVPYGAGETKIPRHVYRYRYPGSYRSGFLGNPYESQLPDLTRPDTDPLTDLTATYDYYGNGLLKTATDTGGLTFGYEYQPDTGYLVGATYPNGTRTFEVDPRGNVTMDTSPGKVATKYEVDGRDLITAEYRDWNGFKNKTGYEYDLNGNLVFLRVDQKDNFGEGSPQPESVGDATITHEMKYSLLDRLTEEKISGSDGETWKKYTHDRNGNIETVEEPSPASYAPPSITTTFTYDGRDLVTSISLQPDLPDSFAGPVTAPPPTKFAYDANDNVELIEEPPGESGERTYVLEYDGFDRQISDIDPTDGVTELTYDARGNVTHSIFTGRADNTDDLVTLAEVTNTYDELDNLISREVAMLDEDGGTVDTKWIFNKGLQLGTQIGPGIGRTHFKYYDDTGWLEKVTDAEGNVVTSEYDDDGNRSRLVETQIETRRSGEEVTAEPYVDVEKEYEWVFDYDALGRLTEQTGPLGTTYQFYDSVGQLRGVVDETGTLVEMKYDGLGRKRESKVAGVTEKYTYASEGLIASVESPRRHMTWEYDALGREVTRSDALTGGKWHFHHNPAGDLAKSRDPNETVIERLRFNKLGLPLELAVTPASGRSRTVQASDGTFIDKIPQYIGTRRELFRYDGLGRVAYAETDMTKTELSYDGLGRVVKDVQTLEDDSQTVEIEYEPTLNYRTVTYPAIARGPGGEFKVESELDGLGRVIAVRPNGFLVGAYHYAGPDRVADRWIGSKIRTEYDYDEAGRLNHIAVKDDQRGHTIWRAAVDDYWHHVATDVRTEFLEPQPNVRTGRIVESTHMQAATDTLGRVRESWTVHTFRPEADGPTVVRGNRSVQSFDEIGRPIGVGSVEFEPREPAGILEILFVPTVALSELIAEVNLDQKVTLLRTDILEYKPTGRVGSTSTWATWDIDVGAETIGGLSAPELEQYNADEAKVEDLQSFEYDANGNLIQDDRYLYSYDHANRLTQAYDWWPNHNHQSTMFIYDALGRRVQMRHRLGDTNYNPTLQKPPTPYREPIRLLYEESRVIAEVEEPDAGAPFLLARYTYGARDEELLRMERRENDRREGELKSYFLHEGVQGSIEFLSEPGGEIVKAVPADLPPQEREGYGTSPAGDRRTVEGSTTRIPYLTWSTRLDGVAALVYEEGRGAALLSHLSAHDLNLKISDEKYWESLEEMRKQWLTIMAAMAAAPFAAEILAPYAESVLAMSAKSVLLTGLVQGTTSVAVSWAITSAMGVDYTAADAAIDFALGFIPGATGARLAKAGYGLRTVVAAGITVDVAAGTAAQMAFYDRDFNEALANNLISAAASQVISAGVGRATTRLGSKAHAKALHRSSPPRTRTDEGNLGGSTNAMAPGRSKEDLTGANCAFCFAPGTQVLTSEGPAGIEDVEVGDHVLSRDPMSGEQEFKRVTETFVTNPTAFVHLQYRPALRAHQRIGTEMRPAQHSSSRATRGDGEEGDDDPGGADDPDPPDGVAEVVGTPGHLVWSVSESDWVYMGSLRPGDLLALADGRTARVESIRVEEALPTGIVKAYNLEVEDWHTYFVTDFENGTAIWVHNFSCSAIETLKILWKETRAMTPKQMRAYVKANTVEGVGPKELARLGHAKHPAWRWITRMKHKWAEGNARDAIFKDKIKEAKMARSLPAEVRTTPRGKFGPDVFWSPQDVAWQRGMPWLDVTTKPKAGIPWRYKRHSVAAHLRKYGRNKGNNRARVWVYTPYF